jgi:hypothetical protein
LAQTSDVKYLVEVVSNFELGLNQEIDENVRIKGKTNLISGANFDVNDKLGAIGPIRFLKKTNEEIPTDVDYVFYVYNKETKNLDRFWIKQGKIIEGNSLHSEYILYSFGTIPVLTDLEISFLNSNSPLFNWAYTKYGGYYSPEFQHKILVLESFLNFNLSDLNYFLFVNNSYQIFDLGWAWARDKVYNSSLNKYYYIFITERTLDFIPPDTWAQGEIWGCSENIGFTNQFYNVGSRQNSPSSFFESISLNSGTKIFPLENGRNFEVLSLKQDENKFGEIKFRPNENSIPSDKIFEPKFDGRYLYYLNPNDYGFVLVNYAPSTGDPSDKFYITALITIVLEDGGEYILNQVYHLDQLQPNNFFIPKMDVYKDSLGNRIDIYLWGSTIHPKAKKLRVYISAINYQLYGNKEYADIGYLTLSNNEMDINLTQYILWREFDLSDLDLKIFDPQTSKFGNIKFSFTIDYKEVKGGFSQNNINLSGIGYAYKPVLLKFSTWIDENSDKYPTHWGYPWLKPKSDEDDVFYILTNKFKLEKEFYDVGIKKDRIFGISREDRRKVYYSSFGQTPNFDAFPEENVITILGDVSEINAIEVRDFLALSTSQKTYFLIEKEKDIFEIDFVIPIGASSRQHLTLTPVGLYIFSNLGLYLVGGKDNFMLISNPIKNLIQEPRQIIYINEINSIYLNFYPNFAIFNLDYKNWITGGSLYLKFVFTDKEGKTNLVDNNGFIWVIDKNNTNVSFGSFSFITNWFDFNLPNVDKVPSRVFARVNVIDENLQIPDIVITFDNGETFRIDKSNFNKNKVLPRFRFKKFRIEANIDNPNLGRFLIEEIVLTALIKKDRPEV